MGSENTYAVPAQYDLGVRTVVRCLIQQICSRLRSSGIAANKVTPDGSRVVDPLHGDIVRSDQVVEIVEEGRANQIANVAKLDRTSREDDGDRFASNAGHIGELVSPHIPVVLTFAERCTGGACLFEGSGTWHVDWDGADG